MPQNSELLLTVLLISNAWPEQVLNLCSLWEMARHVLTEIVHWAHCSSYGCLSCVFINCHTFIPSVDLGTRRKQDTSAVFMRGLDYPCRWEWDWVAACYNCEGIGSGWTLYGTK